MKRSRQSAARGCCCVDGSGKCFFKEVQIFDVDDLTEGLNLKKNDMQWCRYSRETTLFCFLFNYGLIFRGISASDWYVWGHVRHVWMGTPPVCCEPSCADQWVDLLGAEQKRFLRARQGLITVEKKGNSRASYRSGGIALINRVFEVCAKLIKRDDLKKTKNNRRVSLVTFRTAARAHNCDVNTVNGINTRRSCCVILFALELGAARWLRLVTAASRAHMVIKCWMRTCIITDSPALFSWHCI